MVSEPTSASFMPLGLGDWEMFVLISRGDLHGSNCC